MIFDQYGRGIVACAGSIDDGSNDGAIRAHLAGGELVKLPIRDGAYRSEAAGSGFNYLQSGGAFAMGNSDGSGTVLEMVSQDANVHNGGNRVSFSFYGTRLGIRYLAYQAQLYATGFCVEIDGVRYEVRHKSDPIVTTASAAYDEWTWMCPDILKDHKHFCRIQCPGSMLGSNVNFTNYITGIVVE